MINEFSKKVLAVVKRIPKGKVLTYKMVAKLAGFPKAYRAVGNALNKNLHPPKFSSKIWEGKQIPCHRVIRSDGKIGGYRGGTKRKTYLLKKEGVLIKNGRVVV
jgi:O-6-methylguanine DNA methyltransferase